MEARRAAGSTPAGLPTFRAYREADRARCLALFDANCPTWFAPNEREDYERFLDEETRGYEVCLHDDELVGAYGLAEDGADLALCWILLEPRSQRRGLGSAIMERVLARSASAGVARLRISTSHLTAAFFARFGARELSRTPDGWGPGMHRVDMELVPGG